MYLKGNKGIILIACYLVITVLVILSSAFLVRSTAETRIANRERDLIQAFYLAEAGLADAYNVLKGNWNDYTSEFPINQDFPTLLGSYTVVEDGLLANTVKVTSTGTVGARMRTVEQVIRGTAGAGLEEFDFALLVAGNLFLEGNSSIENQDVYVNGNLTIQSPDAVNGGNIYATGNVGLSGGGGVTGNVNANGHINVDSGSTIDGDATSASTVNNLGIITGTFTSGVTPDPVDAEALQATVDSYELSSEDWDAYEAQAQAEGNYHSGNFRPSGTYTGLHYVTGNVVIESDVSGEATFIIEGNVSFTAGSLNLTPPSGEDYSLIVGGNLSSGDDASGTMAGAIYVEGNFAVSSSITIESAILCFGNLHGSGDFSIEFPTAGTTLEILSWREL